MAKKKEKQEERSRNWATVIYPESTPDFLERISNTMIAGFLSPLHEDLEEDQKTEKKPHYHLLIKFASTKSMEQAKELFAILGGVGAECVHDYRAYSRYLCHLDQPNKKRYDPEDVRSFGGEDYLTTIAAVADKYAIIAAMQDYCESHYDEIGDSFSSLCRYARDSGNDEWFRALCDYAAYIMTSFLQSLHWTRRQESNYTKYTDSSY